MLERFPPFFADDAFAYGGALFGLMAISSLFLAVLFDLMHGALSRGSARPGFVWVRPTATREPLAAYRFQLTGVSLMAVLGTFPDVLYLLAWGEATRPFMLGLFRLDRALDLVAAIPGTLAVISYFANKQIVEHRLQFGGVPTGGKTRPPLLTRGEARRYLRVILWAFVAAAGVTLGKASA